MSKDNKTVLCRCDRVHKCIITLYYIVIIIYHYNYINSLDMTYRRHENCSPSPVNKIFIGTINHLELFSDVYVYLSLQRTMFLNQYITMAGKQ